MTSPWSRIVCWSTEMNFCPIWTHDGSFPVSDTVFAHLQQLKWLTTPKNEWIGSICDLEPRANNSFWDVTQDHRGENGPEKGPRVHKKIVFLTISATEVLYTNTEVSGDFQLQKMSELEYFRDSGFCRATQGDTVFFLWLLRCRSCEIMMNGTYPMVPRVFFLGNICDSSPDPAIWSRIPPKSSSLEEYDNRYTNRYTSLLMDMCSWNERKLLRFWWKTVWISGRTDSNGPNGPNGTFWRSEHAGTIWHYPSTDWI